MFDKVNYSDLNSRQKENYNFHKLAGKLADYGFNSIKLSDDWLGADFIAYHINGDDFIKVQLKGRLTIDGKYLGKNIHIGFMDGDRGYLFPHDEVVERILANSSVGTSSSWKDHQGYSWPTIPKWLQQIMDEYEV